MNDERHTVHVLSRKPWNVKTIRELFTWVCDCCALKPAEVELVELRQADHRGVYALVLKVDAGEARCVMNHAADWLEGNGMFEE